MQNQNSAPGGQVYYDRMTGEYYTMKPQGRVGGANNAVLQQAFGVGSPFYEAARQNRNYLGSPLGQNVSPNRFTPTYTETNYPEMNMLFPELNASLLQGLISPQTPTGAMYGAGRFLAPQSTMSAPQTTSESKGK